MNTTTAITLTDRLTDTREIAQDLYGPSVTHIEWVARDEVTTPVGFAYIPDEDGHTNGALVALGATAPTHDDYTRLAVELDDAMTEFVIYHNNYEGLTQERNGALETVNLLDLRPLSI